MKGILHQFLLAVVACCAIGLNYLVSPYRYAWDDSIRQIDDDALLVLRFLNGVIVLFCLLFILVTRKNRESFLRYVPAVIAAFCLYKILGTIPFS